MRYLPRPSLLLFFAVLAVVCGTIASRATAHDKALSLMVFPIFVFSAVMGLWQSGRLSNVSDVDASDE